MAVSIDLFPKVNSIVTLIITSSIIFMLIDAAPLISNNNINNAVVRKTIEKIRKPCGEPKITNYEQVQLRPIALTPDQLFDISNGVQKSLQTLDNILTEDQDLNTFKTTFLEPEDIEKMQELKDAQLNCKFLNSDDGRKILRNAKNMQRFNEQDKINELHRLMEEWTFAFTIMASFNGEKKFGEIEQKLNSALCDIEQVMNDSYIRIDQVQNDRFEVIYNNATHFVTTAINQLVGIEFYVDTAKFLTENLEYLLAIRSKSCKKLKRKLNNKKRNKNKLRKHKIKKHNRKKPKKPHRKKNVPSLV